LYDLSQTIEDKIATVAREIYGAEAIDYTPQAKADLKRLVKAGYNQLPVCIAKTQNSLSDNPALLGRPKDFVATVREIQVAAGAGFVIPSPARSAHAGYPKFQPLETGFVDEGTLPTLLISLFNYCNRSYRKGVFYVETEEAIWTRIVRVFATSRTRLPLSPSPVTHHAANDGIFFSVQRIS
jgi:hypothetical protein